MNLIWKEYIQFLKDNNINLDFLEEGYYWLDRQIIKAYDIDGNLHKIARLYIDDNLNISYKLYPKKDFVIASWNNRIKTKQGTLKYLESQSLNIILKGFNNYFNNYSDYNKIILSSGGKDSSVITHLVRHINNDIPIIFNNTSLDCADTYLHIKQLNNIKTINPDIGFYQWINKTNMIPTRISRACCSIFKEGAMIDKLNSNEKYLFFMGMRNQESNTRSNYKDEWINEKWRNRDWKAILPIRRWSEEDVWLYILQNKIPINQKYKKGYSRVGCAIACPYYTKTTWILDKYWYPKMYKRWHQILEKDFVNNFKWTRLNCTLNEYHYCWNGGLFREAPTHEVINEFAKYKNIEYNIAEKYFNHNCVICEEKINSKDEIAMNLKYLGRNIENLYCKNHLIKYLNLDRTQWNTYIQEFKNIGCELF